MKDLIPVQVSKIGLRRPDVERFSPSETRGIYTLQNSYVVVGQTLMWGVTNMVGVVKPITKATIGN